MDIVIDANVLFAVLIKQGKTEDVLFEDDLKIFAPEFLFEEFDKYRDLILKKTERDEEEFSELLAVLKKRITTIPDEETEEFIARARDISPDPNDADYFALALKMKCALWSNDKLLKTKQDVVKVYSTEDLLRRY
jgi:predicted nucleic acid-binding protein